MVMNQSDSYAWRNPATPVLHEHRIYKVIIQDKTFKPGHIRIEPDAFVEWTLCPDARQSDYDSQYFDNEKSHVIAFDCLEIESPQLKLMQDANGRKYPTVFKLQFPDPGVYPYKCQIFTWMRGTVEVVPPESLVKPAKK